MKHVDVVIISWAKSEELLQVTRQGLDSLFRSEPNGDVTFHAYVVESNHNVHYDEYNKIHHRHTTTTIHPTEEFGYHKYLNIGRKAGNSPYVVLCNSDLTYENDWASNIISAMEKHPQFLSASPWCPQVHGDNTQYKNQLFSGYRVRGELSGWCIFQQRAIYDVIKELNQKVRFWFSDNIYADELRLRGVHHFLVANSVVNHHENVVGETAKTLEDEKRDEYCMGEQDNYLKALEELKAAIKNL